MKHKISSYLVRSCDPDTDQGKNVLSDIFNLWKQVYGDDFSPEEKFEWFYRGNPAGQGGLTSLYAGDERVPIGVQGVATRSWSYLSEEKSIGIFADLAVQKEHRTFGPALKLVKTTINNKLEDFYFCYTFPNEKSAALFKRAGFKELGVIDRYVKVFRFKSYFNKILPGFLSGVASIPFTAFFSIVDTLKIKAIKNCYNVNILKDFDKEFDALWVEVQRNNLIISNRNAKYLSWYFKGKELFDIEIMTANDKNTDCLIGYIVYVMDRNNNVIINDFLSRDFNLSLEHMMLMFIGELRKRFAVSMSLEFYGNREVVSVLTKLGFRKRESSEIMYLSASETISESRDMWYMTHYDRDQ